ncbi:phage tail sheath family protein [Desulfobacula phenolica]|uniref:Tail sheath protein C-terminal domain-containing protein n=1 Tax=Desulfobacula phenolica TaxID=90732 RepID=A0A1H2JQC4_9BACT|nr:phage tail sheath C-terminal domain-containing protein [Desulfobacula phenolica]SDU58235.1 hypothetical protein SAMN04487931_11410 [Desulfobacula phenolica]
MGAMKTPGVYIVEKNAFPNSVVEVATAVPAFIGHTQFAETRKDKKDLVNKPWKISSMVEFQQYFGGGPDPKFGISQINATVDNKDPVTPEAPDGTAAPDGTENQDGTAAPAAAKEAAPATGPEDLTDSDFNFDKKGYRLKLEQGNYLLYYCMKLFYQNGGGPCYIVSVGGYEQKLEAQTLTKGIDLLIKEQEPTMVIIPEAVLLDDKNCISVQQAALQHCGDKMRNRITILDIHKGYKDRKDLSADPDKGEKEGSCIDNFRNALGINFLKFSAAYYPWINTTIIQDTDLGFENFTDEARKTLLALIETEKGISQASADDPKKAQMALELKKMIDPDLDADEKSLLNTTLVENSALFKSILDEIKTKLNLLPPSSAMAGIYTMVDNSRGVWKAPANVSLNSVVSPSVNITHDDQEDLNVTPQGKSINAIRTFIGEGTLVWGGRTLDGNSLDWRYIQVRRTMIMLEESIKLATKAYVFENNVANTWVTIKSMIRNFLTGIWKRGGLAGASPDDAFSVHVGLGETMTGDDILEGILRVTVLVALIRPAEFIEITFQQQMQKS